VFEVRGRHLERTIHLRANSDEHVFDDAALWSVGWSYRRSKSSLTRVDLASGEATANLTVDGGNPLVAAGDGSVWLATRSTEGISVFRVDGRTAAVTARSDLAIPYVSLDSIAFGNGALWVSASTSDGPALYRFDGTTAALDATVRDALPAPWGHYTLMSDLAVGDGALWWFVALSPDNLSLRYHAALVRLDAGSGAVLTRTPVPLSDSAGNALLVGPDSVWTVTDQRHVTEFDRAKGKVVAEIDLGGGSCDLVDSAVVAGTRVVVACHVEGPLPDGSSGRVVVINGAERRVADRYRLNSSPSGIAFLRGAAWTIVDDDGTAVARMKLR
jgi:hypothetical protein